MKHKIIQFIVIAVTTAVISGHSALYWPGTASNLDLGTLGYLKSQTVQVCLRPRAALLRQGSAGQAGERNELSPEDAQLFEARLNDLAQALDNISARIQIIPLTKNNVVLYAEDLADVDITRGDEFGEGFWDAARFMEDARASTGTKLDGKWEYSQVVIVGGKAVGYLIGIRGGVKDFGVPANARHILRLAIAPACRNLKIGTEGKIFLDTNIDLL